MESSGPHNDQGDSLNDEIEIMTPIALLAKAEEETRAVSVAKKQISAH